MRQLLLETAARICELRQCLEDSEQLTKRQASDLHRAWALVFRVAEDLAHDETPPEEPRDPRDLII